GNWRRPCVDVSAPVVAALRWSDPILADRVESWLNAELRCARSTGYWWITPLYAHAAAAWHGVRLAASTCEMLSRRSERVQPVGAFEAALRLVVLRAYGNHAHAQATATHLLGMQHDDGRFLSSAWLRLTDREIADPQNRIDVGSLYIDSKSVFTTSTAVRAL